MKSNFVLAEGTQSDTHNGGKSPWWTVPLSVIRHSKRRKEPM
jgi:hypothetical protein